MSSSLINAMHRSAGQVQADTERARVGTVSSYNPNTYSVKVLLQPSGVETGWLPIKTPWVGNGWGMQAGPTPGDLVTIEFQEGDKDAGVVLGSMFNNEDRPMPVPSGEIWIQHKSGAFFKLTNEGRAVFSDGHGASVTLNGDGTINSTGTWSHEGSITATGDVTAGTVSLQKHKNTGVRSGSDTSGPPAA